MRSAFPPALVPFHAVKRSKIEHKIENPTITLDTYAKSDECCLLHCTTPEGTLIWFPKKESEMKPCE